MRLDRTHQERTMRWMGLGSLRPVVCPLALIALSFALIFAGIRFPLGYHGDEPKKVGFILTGEQDFHHPILILQLGRVANLVARRIDPQQVVLVGRAVSLVAGLATVWLGYLIARRMMSDTWALAAAMAVGVSPIMVVHAQYLKEDVLYTACAMASLLAMSRLAADPSWANVLLSGLATGAAMSAHYKSAILIAMYLTLPLYSAETRTWRFAKGIVLTLPLAAYVFVLVNYPLLDYPAVFLAGVEHESTHVVTGHTLKVYPLPNFFCFHLRHSVLPGMTWPAAFIGIAGFVGACLGWRKLTTIEKLLVMFVTLNYLAAEITPSKPEPDYARYILPIVPPLLILGCRGLAGAARTFSTSRLRTMHGVAVAIFLLTPLADSLLIDYFSWQDTRARADAWLAQAGGKALREHYSGANRDVASLADLNVDVERKKGVDFLVASSFNYDRYFVGSRLPNQDDYVYERHKAYRNLFAHPFVELRPSYKSFAFSNPTIRIVDIRSPPNQSTK